MISEDHSEPERPLRAQVPREQGKVAAVRTPLGPPWGVEANSGLGSSSRLLWRGLDRAAEKPPGILPDGNHYVRPLGPSWEALSMKSSRSSEWKQILPAKWPHGE